MTDNNETNTNDEVLLEASREEELETHILTELFGSGLEDIASVALDIPGAYEVDI